jgi:glycerate 2-kinase
LLPAAYPASLHALMISDVPGDDPAYIASGPTVGDSSTPDDALAIIARYGIDLPASAKAVLSGKTGVIPPGDERLSTTTNTIIAAPSQSLEAAKKMAEAAGHRGHHSWRCAGRRSPRPRPRTGRAGAQEQSEISTPHLLLSGGECTVTRTGDGVGGPNAEYALSLAIALNGADGIHALACDTDGVDGAAEVAGAMVTPNTLAKARAKDIDPHASLANNDAHSFFDGINDQVITGPTLTNVNDFRAILIEPA